MEGPERVRGFALFGQQTWALLVKNALLAWRNKAATFLQLFASFFFIFLVFAVDRSVRASLSGKTQFQNLFTPPVTVIPAIPPCQDGFYMKSSCLDFVWSGNESALLVSLVQNITANNPGRPININTQTMGFATPEDVDTWLLTNPYMTPMALHLSFMDSANKTVAYGLQANFTVKNQRGEFEDTMFKFQVPLQAAAEREIARHIAKDWSIGWTPQYSEYAHPALATLNIIASAGAVFLFAACMFNFVIQMSNIVLEKELKLRQTMATMGLMDSVFWLTWTIWEVGLAIISCLLLVCFGLMFQFDFFLHNSFFVLFFLFFLFWACMTSVAFLFSTFLKKSASANTIGFFVFIIGFILQLIVVFGFPYDKEFARGFQILFSLFPPNLLALGLKYLGDATATPEDPGVSWSGISECTARNSECVLTLSGIYIWLLVLFFVYLILAVYLDNVLPDVNGVRKPCLFFFYPSYWTGSATSSHEGSGCCGCLCAPNLSGLGIGQTVDDVDVVEEENKVKGQANAGDNDPALAISVRGLVKVFPAQSKCCKKSRPFVAVKGPWYNVEKDKLFCLLGPNGAGKSTTINCLTGIIPVTGGDALIYGRTIRSPASMNIIRSSMGVCPQFDILWDRLSGREHLFLYSRIKGIPSQRIAKESETLLEEVKLVESGSVRTNSYSGGMKRRLSVAAALIGDPKVVFLDEPTTGMDPVSRRYVWDIIERAKSGRAIVLTTHSMEEADILGDRIAIMAKGQLRCIGTSIHLKQRFGAGIVVTVRVGSMDDEGSTGGASARVKQFFLDRLGLEPMDEVSKGNFLRFSIPNNKDDGNARQITDFFHELKASKEELGVVDIQLSLTSLEEVFLNIARAAELETAADEGRFDSITLPSGMEVQVPIGAETIFVPGSESAEAPNGLLVDVFWQQDDTGSLRISRSDEPRPASAPVDAQPTASSALVGRKRRGKKVVVGVPVPTGTE